MYIYYREVLIKISKVVNYRIIKKLLVINEYFLVIILKVNVFNLLI